MASERLRNAAIWKSLTAAQRAALSDLGVRSLGRVRAGWGDLTLNHKQSTILALVSRGLAEPRDWQMHITGRGAKVLNEGQANA